MKMSRKDPDFYSIMGPVFGSGEIQRKTGDRFFDDDNKEWHVLTDSKDNVTTVISVSNNFIKNVYSSDTDHLILLLKEIYPEIKKGIVPIVYAEIYKISGYSVLEYSKKFVEITGGYSDESDDKGSCEQDCKTVEQYGHAGKS